MSRALIGTLCATLAVALLACTEEEPSGPAAPSPSVAREKAQAAVIEEQAMGQYSYTPVGKRDPFYSYLSDVEATAQSSRQRRLEATEMYELDQYRLTGLVTGTSQPRAIVEDPEGKGHRIEIGNRIGKRGGVVTRITGEGLVVTEEILTPAGDRVRVPIAIKLPQPELDLMQER